MDISYHSFTGNFIEAKSIIDKEINFFGRGQYYIEIKNEEGELIRFELTYPTNGTKSFKISQENFSESELKDFSRRFNISLRIHPYSKRLTGSIKGLPDSYGYSIYGAEVETTNGVYVCLYAKRGESAFAENIYFIQGIYHINRSLLSS